MDKAEFFAWCERQGLESNKAIAAVLSVSGQTIRNWNKPNGKLPRWIDLAVRGYETFVGSDAGKIPTFPKVTVSYFETWQRKNGLKTYSDVGKALGLSRQAVHNWDLRTKFPNWVALACVGYDAGARISAAKSGE